MIRFNSDNILQLLTDFESAGLSVADVNLDNFFRLIANCEGDTVDGNDSSFSAHGLAPTLRVEDSSLKAP